MSNTGRYLLIVFTLFALFNTAYSADPKTFKAHWLESKANKDGLDAIQTQTAGPGWFSNLGPTGIRALLTDGQGKTEWKGTGTQFVVKFVFKGSPGFGKVLPGDIITGVNGKKFPTPYKFGYWFGWGYEGPITDFGEAVEASERDSKGKIELMLTRKGKEQKVTVIIPPRGVFADTFPFDCQKSRTLKKAAIAWLVRNQQRNGRWPGQTHAQVMTCLALLAQGKQYHRQVAFHLDKVANSFNDRTWNWQLSLYAIVMSEFTLATKNPRYARSMMKINELLKKNRRFKNGTYGHEGNAGSDGYGPMSGMTGMVCLAWTMLDKCKLKIHMNEYTQTLMTMDMELVRNDGDSRSGDYGYGWPNKGVKVYDFTPEKVIPSLDHLKVDIATFNKARAAGIPKGAMALVHSIRPWQKYSPQVATHHINKITRTRRCLVNGHGSGMLHAWICFLALGYAANNGNEKPLRLALDTNRALINSARCPDGSFYTQVQRDDLGGDLGRGSRTLPTALWATVFSIPDKKLVLLGREIPGSPKVKK